MMGGGSHYSQRDLTLRFGRGQTPQIQAITVTWPSGLRHESTHLDVNSHYILTEGASAPDSTALIRSTQASPSPDIPR